MPRPRRPWLPVVAIALADALRSLLADSWGPSGLLDEVSHLATGLLVLACLGRRSRAYVVALLASSVLIDLDHVPQLLGARWLTAGTARPYPHSLLTLVVVATGALATRGRLRAALLGALVGLIAHLFRDLGEPNSGVALLWPISDHTFSLPYPVFGAAMLALLGVALARVAGDGRALRCVPHLRRRVPGALGGRYRRG